LPQGLVIEPADVGWGSEAQGVILFVDRDGPAAGTDEDVAGFELRWFAVLVAALDLFAGETTGWAGWMAWRDDE